MNQKAFKRKLSAILSADAVGYSRLMGDDDEATVRTLTAYRTAIADLVHQFHGRIVDNPGDNILAEFNSVVYAVNCAVEIQRDLGEKNMELPENRRMLFRIGVNLGDVIEEEDRIYGDGVNIAARVEGLAEAGGICVSGTAYDQVKNRIKLGFTYLGGKKVKNIREPVPAYAVDFDSKTHFQMKASPLELPDTPSIAVLPLVIMSDEPAQTYFSDGITEEIITALSKIPGLHVIARNSTFVYKNTSVNVQQVASELGVRYVLEGSVRKSGSRVRITAQLIDAVTGKHIWAERYDQVLDDIFAVQDDITKRIVVALQIELTEGEQARLSGKGTDNLEAYLKNLQAREQFYRMNRQGTVRARELVEEAIKLDPAYAGPYVISALTHMMDLWFQFTESPEESLKLAGEAAEKALSLDGSDPSAHAGLCMFHIMQRKHDEAISSGKRAVTLSPSGASAHTALGTALTYAGKHEEAIAFYKKALSLNPFPPSIYLRNLGTAFRMSGRYQEALAEYKKSLSKSPDDLFTHLGLAICYVCLGFEEKAKAEAAEILRIHPEFSLSYFAETLPYKHQSEIDKDVARLRRTGLQ